MVLSALAALVPVAAFAQSSTEIPAFGTGTQVFGASAEYAPAAGEIWGYTTHTRFESLLLQYSVAITHGKRTRLRYAPELVPFATLLERTPSETNPTAPVRSYAYGARPVGLELDLRRGSRVEPVFSTNEGFLYYNRRVLSPGGSQFMYTLDFGGGVRVFASPQNALTVSYRYQHESNANISLHNPGTDNHVIAIGFSHFTRR
ncbi:hypothetical protein GCM10022270_29950 [Terriglobus aquaticus]